MKLQELLKIVTNEFKPSLQKHLYGVLFYGSGARVKEYKLGWSDLDILVVANYDVVCPREFYDELASWYARMIKSFKSLIEKC